MRRVAAFLALPWGDRILLLQSVATVVAVGWLSTCSPSTGYAPGLAA